MNQVREEKYLAKCNSYFLDQIFYESTNDLIGIKKFAISNFDHWLSEDEINNQSIIMSYKEAVDNNSIGEYDAVNSKFDSFLNSLYQNYFDQLLIAKMVYNEEDNLDYSDIKTCPPKNIFQKEFCDEFLKEKNRYLIALVDFEIVILSGYDFTAYVCYDIVNSGNEINRFKDLVAKSGLYMLT